MGVSDDLVPTLASLAGGSELGFRAGLVTAWDAETGANTVDIGGAEIHDMPILVQTEKLAIQAGEVVAVLTTPRQSFILGRLKTDEGEIVVRSSDGQVQFRIGRASNGGGELATYHPNGEPHAYLGQLYNILTGEIFGQGFLVQDDKGTDLFSVRSFEAGGPQVVRIIDAFQNLAFITRSNGGWSLYGTGPTLVASTDETHGNLLHRPYLDVAMYPVVTLVSNAAVYVGVNGTTSGSFQDFWHGRLYVTHPHVHVQALVQCATGGVTGEVRVFIDDVNVSGNVAFSNTVADYIDFGNLALPASALANPWGYVRIRINGRRTGASTGPIVITPYGVTKRGTP